MSESKFEAKTLASFGASKLRDTPKYLKDAPEVSRGLWQWYTRKYLGNPNPLFHFMVFVGVIGYAFNYHHLKHEKEDREKCIREGRPVKII